MARIQRREQFKTDEHATLKTCMSEIDHQIFNDPRQDGRTWEELTEEIVIKKTKHGVWKATVFLEEGK